MKDERRRKAKKEWAEFQLQYQLSDEDIKRASATGYPLQHFQNLPGTDNSGNEISMSQRIEEFHRQWTERVAKRRAEIETGAIVLKVKTPAKKTPHDPKWAEAKQVCRLTMDDIRKAKELGLSPQALMKNVPSRSQEWKAPVKVWIQDLYEKRFGARDKFTKNSDSIAGDSHQSTKTISGMPASRESEISHDSIVRDWEKNAERNSEKSYLFLRSFKFNDYGFDVDAAAHELHQTAFQTVDCTRCANCCKSTTPKFDQSDVERVAAFLEMTPTEFIGRYLEPKPNATYNTRRAPCPLLGKDNRCTVYEVRPTVCREYPHTDKEGLAFRTMGVANNTTICPAVFWIVEKLKERVREGN
ncbi:MAG: YkgJ family cysteine cluster protein [Pirellulaceae bacterium]|nr:YkgJ family cysteine cluster protein [Pirellulaceae bacterium]